MWTRFRKKIKAEEEPRPLAAAPLSFVQTIFASPVFTPECSAAGLEQQPGVHALAAQFEVHGHLFAQRTDGLPFLDGRVSADGEGLQAVKVAAQAAAVVDDDGVAGEGKVPGKDDDAVRRSAGRVAGDGVELGGVGAGTLLAVRDLDLTEIQQDEIVLGRADEPAGPEFFPPRSYRCPLRARLEPSPQYSFT